MARVLTVYTLASGSSGNCTLVTDGEVHILIDAGISCRRISQSLARLELTLDQLSAIFITHEHTDHTCGLATISKKYEIPLFASAQTARQICYRVPFADRMMQPIEPGDEIIIDAMTVSGFATLHDCPGSMGYTVCGERGKMAIATDLGTLTDEVLAAVAGVDLLIAETNHDLEMLESGPYPYYLKERIRGSHGHLSNEDGAKLCRHSVLNGAKTLILAHLSQENNTPLRAHTAVSSLLAAEELEDIILELAPRSELSRPFAVVS